MRAIFDANIFISDLLSTGQEAHISKIINAAFLREFTLLLPEDLLDELARTIRGKERLRKRISDDRATRMIELLSAIVEKIPSLDQLEIPQATRDPKDDYLLAHALLNKIDYLVTRDKDLLVLKQVKDVKIVPPSEFLKVLYPPKQVT